MWIVFERHCYSYEQGCNAGMGTGGCSSGIYAFYNKAEANKFLNYIKKNSYGRAQMDVCELNSKKVYIIICYYCYKELPWKVTDITFFDSYEEAHEHYIYMKQHKQHSVSHYVMRSGFKIYSSYNQAVKDI